MVKNYHPELHMDEREQALKQNVTSAVIIGKQVDKDTPTLESVMHETFMLENLTN